MFVVYNKSTGWNDEGMRHATKRTARDQADALEDITGEEHGIRFEPAA